MVSASFGDIKLIPAAKKSYCLYFDKKTQKLPLLFEITEKHTSEHLTATKLLMEYAQKKGLTKQKVMDQRQVFIEEANTIKANLEAAEKGGKSQRFQRS